MFSNHSTPDPRRFELRDMSYTVYGFLSTLGLFFGMLILLEVGWRNGIRRMTDDADGEHASVVAIESAVFGLLGLIIAFTFSGATTRFDARRQLIVEETNAIGTAYLRVDLLAPGAQPALRENFRRYLDARLGVYQKLPDIDAAKEELAKANKLQGGNLAPSISRFASGGRSSRHRQTNASSHQPDDRYHYDADYGDANASADDHLRHALRTGSRERAAGRLRHGRWQVSQLAP